MDLILPIYLFASNPSCLELELISELINELLRFRIDYTHLTGLSFHENVRVVRLFFTIMGVVQTKRLGGDSFCITYEIEEHNDSAFMTTFTVQMLARSREKVQVREVLLPVIDFRLPNR